MECGGAVKYWTSWAVDDVAVNDVDGRRRGGRGRGWSTWRSRSWVVDDVAVTWRAASTKQGWRAGIDEAGVMGGDVA